MTSESRGIEIDSKGETESDEAPRASVDTGRNAGMNASVFVFTRALLASLVEINAPPSVGLCSE